MTIGWKKMTREEMETVIRCSAADREWDIVTADSRIKTKLRNRGYEPKPDHQFPSPYQKYTLPFSAVSFRRQRVSKAILSENQLKNVVNLTNNTRKAR